MSNKFKNKDIYKDLKATFSCNYSLLNLRLMVNGRQLGSKQTFQLVTLNSLVAFCTGLVLVGLSFSGIAQCKKTASTCNLTNLRNAFTTKGFQELGCGADSCSVYFISGTAQSNAQADSTAKSLGGNLVSFQNIISNDSVVKWANDAGFSGSVWTGYNDKLNEGKFVWTDGRDTTFKNWANGQPNGGGGSEDCVVLQLNGADSGKWADTTCNLTLRSIVRVSLCMTVSINDTNICLNDSVNLTSFVSLGSPGYTFNWSPVSTDSIFKVSPSASTTFNITITDRYSCTAKDTARVRVDTLPSFVFKSDSICRGDSISYDLSAGFSKYLWSTGDTSQTIKVSDSLTYWAKRTNANGCSYADTFRIINNPLPLFSLSNDTTVCIGDTIVYKSPFSHPTYTYKWQDLSTADSLIVTGSVSVQLEVTDSNGCVFKNGPVVTSRIKPTINLGSDQRICKGSIFTFNQGLSTSLLDRWILNNDTSINSSYAVDTSGTLYYYGLDQGNCPGYDTVNFTLDTLPILNLGNDTNLCFGDSIQLDAGSGMSKYIWTSGDTTQFIKIGTTGAYRIFAEDKNGCRANANFVLTIDSLPEFSIRRNGYLGDTSICTNDSVLLTVDTSSTFLYSWNGRPFVSGDDSNYVNNGSQNVVIIKDTNNCLFSDTLSVSLDTLPLVNIRTDTTICAGDSILIRVNSDSNYLHVWNGFNLRKLDSMWVKKDTTYEVELIDRNNTCRQSDTVKVLHDTLPIISIGGDTTFCAGDTISIDAGPKMFSYLWSSTDTTQLVKYSSPGVYTVDVIDSNECKTSAIRKIFMSQLPTPNLGPDREFCAGSAVNEILNAGGGYSLYEWSTGKTGDSTLAQRDTVLIQDTYLVTVTDSIGCKAMDTILINANFLPLIELGPDTFFCDGNKFNFLIGAGPGYVKYEWTDFTNFPTITPLPSTGQILLISDTAANIICKITDNKGCTNEDTISIIKMPVPVVDIGVTNYYCESEKEIFIDSLNADPANLYKSYEWSTGDTVRVLFPNVAGKYTVTVTANNGCKSTDEKEIIEIPYPTVDFSGDTLYCLGSPLTLDAYMDGYLNYYWYKVSEIAGVDDVLLNPLLEPIDSLWPDTAISEILIAEPGKFKVILKYGQYPGCEATFETEIRQDINPVIDFGIRNSDTTLCAGELLTLQPNFSGKGSTTENMIFEWQDGSPDSVYQVRSTGLYQLVLTNDCGADIDDIQVNFEDCSNLWIANSFTPNGDDDNDRWGVKSLEGFFEFRLQVFDNMGRMVWETTLPEIEWDGTHITNGEPQPIGTYIYRLTYRSKFELVEGVNSAATKDVTGQLHLFR
ncbi:MAG: gliding motility-associated C-terminal domain-containing protein [Salibacteraceae bacterium]|nr:gliding motility-associated C-terminal domain-containing protein [Salibacteraceae bacterium]